jgi:type II secretory ATPase GspE/PulE/Tfp pilus assembly ATPase PilB-like protein
MTTLHTNNAVETLGRMIDMGGEPYLIASTVVCILAQRLVRVICPQCKETFRPTEEELFALKLSTAEAATKTFYRGKGCPNCRSTGYKGRVGVFELLMNTRQMRELITQSAPVSKLFAAAREQKMRTMMEDGMDKVFSGVTTPSELIHAVYTSAGLDAPTEEDVLEEDEDVETGKTTRSSSQEQASHSARSTTRTNTQKGSGRAYSRTRRRA